jgi:hypothetical protein
VLEVVLSVRNTVALLTKVFTPGSACSLLVPDVPPVYAEAVVRIEPDEIHYASDVRRGAPPGALHPFTEQVLRLVQEAVEDLLAPDDSQPPRWFRFLPAADADTNGETS